MGTQKLDLQNFFSQWSMGWQGCNQGLVPLRLNIFWCCFFLQLMGSLARLCNATLKLTPNTVYEILVTLGEQKCVHTMTTNEMGNLWIPLGDEWSIKRCSHTEGLWSCSAADLQGADQDAAVEEVWLTQGFFRFTFQEWKKVKNKSPEDSFVSVNPTHIANDKPWD